MAECVTVSILSGTHESATLACRKWHYLRTKPASPLQIYDIYENGAFIGCVIFTYGANNSGIEFGLNCREVATLSRVALSCHVSPVSQIVMRCIADLKVRHPQVKLIVSYADPSLGHHGGIYQAMNWVYVGTSCSKAVQINGRIVHRRSCYNCHGTSSISKLQNKLGCSVKSVNLNPKYKYYYAINKKIQKRILDMRKPYPKRVQ